jgi:hypothetical protein
MSGRSQDNAMHANRRHAPSEQSRPPGVIDHQIRHCIRAFGLRALLVATDGAHAFVGSARNPKVAMNGLRSRYGDRLAPRRVWWGLPDGIIALHLACSATARRHDATIHALLDLAREQDIALTSDHIVRARAYDLIECVNLEFARLRRNDPMRVLDQAFTVERRRRPSLQYEEFVQRFKIRMLYAIAQPPSAALSR